MPEKTPFLMPRIRNLSPVEAQVYRSFRDQGFSIRESLDKTASAKR